jgi:hypothetical protein
VGSWAKSIAVWLKASTQLYKVLSLAKSVDESSWKEYHARNTTKGVLKACIWVQKVYTWDGKSTSPRQEILVVQRITNDKGVHEYKCSLSNALENEHSWLELA